MASPPVLLLPQHPSHTLTSSAIPKWGRGMLWLEQLWSNTFPQLRQWCLRFVNENGVRQRRQTSESTHAGAVEVDSRAADKLTAGGGGNGTPGGRPSEESVSSELRSASNLASATIQSREPQTTTATDLRLSSVCIPHRGSRALALPGTRAPTAGRDQARPASPRGL